MANANERLVKFAQENESEFPGCWQDPVMQDLLSTLMIERGIAQLTREIDAQDAGIKLETLMAYLLIAHVAGQKSVQKAEVLRAMLGLDPSTLDTIVCPGCAEIWREEQLGERGSCRSCGYENNDEDPQRLMTLGELMLSFGEYNNVMLGGFLRALRALGVLVLPEVPEEGG